MELSIAGGIREFGASAAHSTAVIDGDRRLTFGEVHDRSSRLGQDLLAAGLDPGDRVAVLLGNRAEWPEIAAGLAKAGLVMVPLGTRSTAAENAYILDHADVRALIADAALLGNIATPPPVVRLIDGGYEDALAKASAEDPRVPVSERDPFTIVYTSGTTGRPKGVLISHRSRSLTFYCSALEWGLGPGRTSLAVAPMYHGAGFAFGYTPVFAGGTVAMLRSFDAPGLLAALAESRAQSVFLVPTHAHQLRASGLVGEYDLSALDTIFFNAAALPTALKDWVLEAFPGVGVHELYGSTEGGIVTDCRPAYARTKPGSVGPAWFMTEIKLLDDADAEVGPGEPGELCSRSPFLMNGYLKDEAATAAALTSDGFYRSGDIAVRDADGFVTIVDRKKDMIISGGVNIAPREVEEVVNGFPGVAETAVVGLPDDRWGESVTAFVVALPGASPDPDAIVAHCRTVLSGPKVPRRVEFLPVLPRNAAGKILKRELRKD
ncbi:class I adenylate-forming enzyme family protein [Actinocorallia sp. A-T 12471]|uniref:class I adenylate-forming enzyme family protein n=1 Tax=Actinocorallia sp. A-T 12471 TaxID=3089813 RepID=UPI0029CCEB40|nr:AMP-binding protein [Actinocorallia sp. A-T 12471]MDX6744346.1 AMP-binding protein [Actinocorallia sp. A-T 12471]